SRRRIPTVPGGRWVEQPSRPRDRAEDARLGRRFFIRCGLGTDDLPRRFGTDGEHRLLTRLAQLEVLQIGALATDRIAEADLGMKGVLLSICGANPDFEGDLPTRLVAVDELAEGACLDEPAVFHQRYGGVRALQRLLEHCQSVE